MTTYSRLAVRVGAAIALLAGLAGNALAAPVGTPSQTTIKNTAKLDYSVNGTPQNPICSKPGGNSVPLTGGATVCNDPSYETQIKVDTKINILITTTDTAAVPTTPGAAGVMTFTVTNNGNATQDIALTTVTNVATSQTVFTAPNVATDSFNPTSCTLFQADGTTPVAGSKLTNVASGDSVTVKVSCTIDATNGAAPFTTTDAALVALKGQALNPGSNTTLADVLRVDAATPGVVLADAAGSDDIARDGFSSARSALKAAPAALTVTKVSAILCDPSNGSTAPKAIPGAYIRYTVTITNGTAAGTSTARMTTVGDNLDPNVSFDSDFIVGTGAAAACTPVSATGTATSALGSVQVNYSSTANTRAGFPKYVTTATAITGAVGSQVLGIPQATWNTLLPVEAGYANVGEVKPGDTLTVVYNVVIR